LKVRSAALSAVAASVLAIPFPHGASATGGGGPTAPRVARCLEVQALTPPGAQDAAARRYWTRARIGAARAFSRAALRTLARPRPPVWGRQLVRATQCIPQTARSRGAAPLPARTTPATATAGNGYPTIGKLIFKADGVLPLNCTATVINGTAAPNRGELILTAAHCIEGTLGGIPYTSTDLAFSPMWHDNTNPYGTGYQQGGPASGSPSYSSYWTAAFAAVVKAAVNYER
jgi:hypothetical protein